MKKLKFRVWDKARNKYLEESENSLHCFTDYYIDFNGQIVGFEGMIDAPNYVEQTNLKYIDFSKRSLPVFESKDRFVIQQFTGLFDKDGKEIYEGDIISDGGINVSVEFYKGCFGAKFTDVKYCDKRQIYCNWFHPFYFDATFLERDSKITNFEIVGNIFENKDLLND